MAWVLFHYGNENKFMIALGIMEHLEPGIYLNSLPLVGALSAMLGVFHLVLFGRHPQKTLPESQVFLWLALFSLALAVRGFVDLQRFTSSDIPSIVYWQHWFWTANTLMILSAFLYFPAVENRWPRRWEGGAIGVLLLFIVAHHTLPYPIAVEWQGAPYLQKIFQEEWVYLLDFKPKVGFYGVTLLSLLGMVTGIRTGLSLRRSPVHQMQGSILLLICSIIILVLFYNALSIVWALPPLVWLIHLLALLLFVMTIAITDSAFKSNVILHHYDRLRIQLTQLIQTAPGVSFQLLVTPDHQQTRFTYVSPRLPELFGIEVEPLDNLMDRITAQISEDEQEQWLQAIEVGRMASQPLLFTGKLKVSQGLYRWFKAQSSPVAVPEGTLHSGILMDVSREKDVELEKNALLTELNLRNRELESIMYSATHDLRTPLVNLECFSNELLESLKYLVSHHHNPMKNPLPVEWVDAELREPILRLHENARRIGSRLTALLHLTRSGRTLLLVKRGNPLEVIQKVHGHMLKNTPNVWASVTVYLPSSLPPCIFDSNQLFEVMKVIFENAVQYQSPQRSLVLSINGGVSPTNTCLIEFQDNGQGFDNRYAEIIFECFHQLNPSQSSGEGIGLALARTAMQRMQGAIYAKGRPREGATFVLELPLDS